MKVKLRARERLLMALYALLGMAAIVAISLLIAGGMEIHFMGYAITLGRGTWQIVVLAAIVALLLLWSIKIITLAFRREPKVDKSSVSVQNTENGSVRISVGAMDTLVKRAIGETDGIADIKTRIINHEDSISVEIDMTLQSDVHIPNVTMLMQRSIKNFIEEFSGIAVREVTVMVSKIIEVTPLPPLALTEGHGDAEGEPAPASPANAPEVQPAFAAPDAPEDEAVDGIVEEAPSADDEPEEADAQATERYPEDIDAPDEPGDDIAEADQAESDEEDPHEPDDDEDTRDDGGFSEKDLW